MTRLFRAFACTWLLAVLAAPAIAQPISSLPSATLPLSDTELSVIVQSGTTKKVPVSSLKAAYRAAAAPSSPVAGQLWFDTTISAWVLKQYDSTSWVIIGTLDTSAHTWTPAGGAAPANPTATIGASAVNGSASSFMRSDAAPALPATLPALDGSNLTNLNPSNLSTVVPTSKGGSGADNSSATGIPVYAAGTATVTATTGTGAPVRATSPTLVTPILGTPSSGNASNLTNIPVANATGVLPSANGGAGTVSGIVKANGSGATSAAVAGTDYQAPITLTTTGSSGAATLAGSTLNIPQYSGGGTPGDPTATIGATAVNGSATTYMRSDAAPALPATLPALDGSNLTNLDPNNLSAAVPTDKGGAGSVSGILAADGFGNVSAAVAGAEYQAPIAITTTGTSGPATFVGNVLNIPEYSGGGGGGSPLTVTDGTASVTSTTTITAGKGFVVGGSAGSATIDLTAVTQTYSFNHTVSALDMGASVTLTGSGTLTIPAISGTVFASNQSMCYSNSGSGTWTISSSPTINGMTGTSLPPGADGCFISNGSSIDWQGGAQIASTSKIGSVRPDGTTLTIDPSTGVLSSVGSVSVTASTSDIVINPTPGTSTFTVGSKVTQRAYTGVSDAIVSTDFGKTVTYNNAGSIAAALPQATGSFAAGFWYIAQNLGAGAVTTTIQTSGTFDNGLTTLVLNKGQTAKIWSDGTNWHASPTRGVNANNTLVGNSSGSSNYPTAQTVGTGVLAAMANALSAAGGITSTVASGTSALGTSAIGSGNCATAVTTTATNVATTDVIQAGFNSDPTGVTGYSPTTGGMLTIISYPSANNVNFKVCNNTNASITPGAITLNWRVAR